MKEQFKSINILWLALLAGQLIFFLVTYFLVPGTGNESMEIFQTIVPVVMLGALGGVYLISRRRTVEGAALDSLEEKVNHYRATIIIRSALLEGANLLAIVAMLIDQPGPYLLYFAVGIAAFLYFRPVINRFVQDYQVSEQEAQELRA